jgi:hypothetical protein
MKVACPYSNEGGLGITWLEYVYLDMIYHLSKEGWCYKSLENTAIDLGIDRSNVYRMRNRLIKKGLVKKSIKGHVKTTVMYAKCIRSDNQVVAKRTAPYAKRDYTVGETQPKNNNRNTLDLGKGYEMFKNKRKELFNEA